MTDKTKQQIIRDQIDALYEQAGITGKEKAKELALMTAVEVVNLDKNAVSIKFDDLVTVTVLIQEA